MCIKVYIYIYLIGDNSYTCIHYAFFYHKHAFYVLLKCVCLFVCIPYYTKCMMFVYNLKIKRTDSQKPEHS